MKNQMTRLSWNERHSQEITIGSGCFGNSLDRFEFW
jgi:hypothetical protein